MFANAQTVFEPPDITDIFNENHDIWKWYAPATSIQGGFSPICESGKGYIQVSEDFFDLSPLINTDAAPHDWKKAALISDSFYKVYKIKTHTKVLESDNEGFITPATLDKSPTQDLDDYFQFLSGHLERHGRFDLAARVLKQEGASNTHTFGAKVALRSSEESPERVKPIERPLMRDNLSHAQTSQGETNADKQPIEILTNMEVSISTPSKSLQNAPVSGSFIRPELRSIFIPVLTASAEIDPSNYLSRRTSSGSRSPVPNSKALVNSVSSSSHLINKFGVNSGVYRPQNFSLLPWSQIQTPTSILSGVPEPSLQPIPNRVFASPAPQGHNISRNSPGFWNSQARTSSTSDTNWQTVNQFMIPYTSNRMLLEELSIQSNVPPLMYDETFLCNVSLHPADFSQCAQAIRFIQANPELDSGWRYSEPHFRTVWNLMRQTGTWIN